MSKHGCLDEALGLRDWWDRLVYRLGGDFPPTPARLEAASLKRFIFAIGMIAGGFIYDLAGFVWTFAAGVAFMFGTAVFHVWRSPPDSSSS